jgi:hypothetical protein
MRKVLCSIGVGPHQELLSIAEPSLADYAARHGYDLRLVSGPLGRPSWPHRIFQGLHLDYDKVWHRRVWHGLLRLDALIARFVDIPRPPAWAKIRLVSELLTTYDAVLWIDSDAVIVDGRVDIASYVVPGKWFYAVESTATDFGRHLNTGVFLAIRTPDSLRFFESVWHQYDLIHHQWWEQAAIQRLFGYAGSDIGRSETDFSSGLQLVGEEWNAIPPTNVENPRVMHFAGRPHLERVSAMRSAALERNPLPN